MIKKISKVLLVLAILLISVVCLGSDSNEGKDFRLLFTHDIHSYMDSTTGIVDGEIREYGGMAKLKTLVNEYKDANTIYVDGGDIAMGTLYQAGFATDAYELRMLGAVGCDITTFGNHEFDYGLKGVTSMLNSAMNSDDTLPTIIESSFNFSSEPTADQILFKNALDKYGVDKYVIKEINGVKVAFFAVEGYDSIDCIQADISFNDYIEVSQAMVNELKDQSNVIVCLSHSGTTSANEGEDIDLANKVSGIDVIISAHSHSTYKEALNVNGTIIVSAGCYLENLGKLDFTYKDGALTLNDYTLIPIDENVAEDPEITATLLTYKENIQNTYLKLYGGGGTFDDVICKSNHNFISLEDMYKKNGEYDIGNLIADSYIYKAKSEGIDDIDVAIVGLGTIRGSILEGNVTLSDAFEICSLGVGSDGTAGHPLVSAYITGKELKLLVELDASLGNTVSSIKMSYSGLKYTYNSNRVLLDRVTDIYLVDDNGGRIEINDDQLYKVCCNMYAANMLGMVNDLTKGILKIEPKNADGSLVTDYYSVSLKTINGKEIKEWVAFKDYLSSFDDGVINESYYNVQGRKVDTNEAGLIVLKNPGLTTILVVVLILILILIIIKISVKTRKKIRAKNSDKKSETEKAQDLNSKNNKPDTTDDFDNT